MSDILIKCGVCGAVLDEEDLFCPNCGTEAPLPGSGETQAANDGGHTPAETIGACQARNAFDARHYLQLYVPGLRRVDEL